jgi:hypothetical protein
MKVLRILGLILLSVAMFGSVLVLSNYTGMFDSGCAEEVWE